MRVVSSSAEAWAAGGPPQVSRSRLWMTPCGVDVRWCQAPTRPFSSRRSCERCAWVATSGSAAAGAAVAAAATEVEDDFETKVHARVQRFLQGLALFPEMARVVMVDVIGVGPIGAAKRDEMLQAFADFLVSENDAAHRNYGAPKFTSPDDAYAIVGAIMELASRQLRTGHPEKMSDLEPIIERVVAGVLEQGVSR